MDLVVKKRDRLANVHLERTDNGYRVKVDDETYEVDVADIGEGVHSFVIAGRQYVVSVRAQSSQGGAGRYRVSHLAGADDIELMDPLTHLAREAHGNAAGSGSQEVRAYMPGRVVRILVEEGQEVEAGQGVVVLEAMKMENEIQAEHGGTVARIVVEEGQAVEGGDVLFELVDGA